MKRKTKALSIILCIIILVACIPMSVGASDFEIQDGTASVWIGGVKITESNASDVFGDGKVSFDAATNTLTLNNYEYNGEGYQYYNEVDEETDIINTCTAVIYVEGSIVIEIIGNNTLINSFDDPDNNHYGDIIVVTDGGVKVTGDGSLDATGAFGIDAAEGVIIDGGLFYFKTTDDAIGSTEGSITIKNGASISIIADGDGIYSFKDTTIIDSNINIRATMDGIYSYDGFVTINCTKSKVSSHSPNLEGASVYIEAEGKYGIFGYLGLSINDKMEISSPKNAEILKKHDDEYDFDYYSIFADGETVMDLKIEPKGYDITIEGLSFTMSVLVPVGMSANEAYRDIYETDDFSSTLDTEKEGYTFVGWFTDEACTKGNEFYFSSILNDDVTIYPKWIPNEHAHTGGEASCKDKAICDICEESYGELGQHKYENGICTVCSQAEPSPEKDYTVWYIMGGAVAFAVIAACVGFAIYKKKKRS